jgi:hypothetical protein
MTSTSCCKALNPLRRDGTSQPQRFPLPLGEDYVKIDERSIADILNFTQRLAKEFNYVNGANNADGTWVEFFQEDLSFLLASIAAVDLEEYRARFLDAYEDAEVAQAALEAFIDGSPAGNPTAEAEYGPLITALDTLFQSFLASFTSSTTGETRLPMPQLLDEWYELLPASDLFGDGSLAYSFKDEVKEARARLKNSLQKLNVAHLESTTELDITGLVFVWGSLDGYNGFDGSWGVSDNPVIFPRKYFTPLSGNNLMVSGAGKVLELLKVAFDAFYGMLASLQARIPDFLAQSLADYPYHSPQNGLFLAFVNLYTHAQAHLNRIGRKHLLYYYADVLRFNERDLVPDQAVLIFSLRKGVTQHLIEKGKLLNAGKDVDGKALYYEVSEETVVTPATIDEIRTVYVERTISPTAAANATVPTLPVGIYCAPVAKSSDGQGADLDEDEPKWFPFGQAQYGLEAARRNMVDAELGWAIGSPIFMMKEGLREVFLSYTLACTAPDGQSYPLAIELLSDPAKRAIAEADLREGLSATYTSLKGWGEATVSEVIIARTTHEFNVHSTLGTAYGVGVAALGPSGNPPIRYVVSLKVVLDETAPACSQYKADIHGGTFATEWPVLKLSFTGRTDSYQSLGIPPISNYIGNATIFPNGGSLGLWEGNVYEKVGGIVTQLEDYAAALTQLSKLTTGAPFTAWEESLGYDAGEKVLFEGEIYAAKRTFADGSAESQADPSELGAWAKLDNQCCLYTYLEKAVVEKVNVRVKVTGAAGLVLENDNGKIKSGKPFQPWTALPVVGSRFYVGSKEIFGKQLEALSLRIKWQDPPADISSYYSGYLSVINPISGGSTGSIAVGKIGAGVAKSGFAFEDKDLSPKDAGKTKTKGFEDALTAEDVQDDDDDPATSTPTSLTSAMWTAKINFLHEGKWNPMGPCEIFAASSPGDENTIALVATSFTQFERDIDLTEVTVLETNTPSGFIRLELATPNIAFGHKYYRDLYVANVTAKVDSIVNSGVDDPGPPPNEPYTPVIKEFRIDYSSKVTIDLTDSSSQSYHTHVEQFFHLHPFGETEEHAYLSEGAEITLLPQLPDTGYLYLGISSLTPPSTLSVLFQLAEGSADPDLDRYAPTWSLLSSNKWIDLLTSEIPSDSTESLIASGIIKFVLDKDITEANTLLPSGYHWLRGAVALNTEAIHQAFDIIAQAVPVSFYDQSNNPEHLLSALPSGTITSLKVNDSSVKKVAQPYASFGGKYPEQDDAFLTRVSERLRHKYRSVNIWDYERMVLEEFPSIYKAKCLNHTQVKSSVTGGEDWEIAPGYVTLVTIPDLRNVNAVNPFEPKTPLHILDDVADFLREYVSAWVDLKVTNPEYEQIEITCSIGFVAGKDPGFYITALEEEIKEFLSPWAFDQTVDIVFGGKIHRSQIIHFIERRDYVDFVVNFQMNHTTAGGTKVFNVEEALATTSRSILVSALSHTINSIQPEEVNCAVSAATTTSSGNCCGCQDC